MKRLIILGVVILILIGGVFLFIGSSSSPSSTQMTDSSNSSAEVLFSNPKKSAHYESNTPLHGSILADAPINVVIDFNFDLAVKSIIKIEKDGIDYGLGESVIDDNKLSMRRSMDSSSPDGVYTVMYNACWPDGSCHDGNFQFAIDRVSSSSFEDMTGQKEVNITMNQLRFMPMNLKISKGTKITWVNDDEFEHYVNTDSHPAHTYYPNQNSNVLKNGDIYSVTFDTEGIYPYHCSVHADSMTGNILVE